MNFSTETPDEILENPYAAKLITVLDKLEDYKQSELDKALRFYRSPTNFNLSYLQKRLNKDYGFPTIPADFPKDVLDALLLCAEEINALRGSKQGLQLWLWCLTFGAITIDDSQFYPLPQFLTLDDPQLGFLDQFSPNVATNPPAIPDLFLFDDYSQYGQTTLIIDIDTKYFNHPSIPLYINTHIKKYLTFVTTNAVITITFNNGVYNTNPFPYQKFVI